MELSEAQRAPADVAPFKLRIAAAERPTFSYSHQLIDDGNTVPFIARYRKEVTGSLDDESAEVILELLKGVHIRGATVIIATHDKALMRKTGGQMLHLQQGRLETSSYIEKQYDNAIF